MSATFIQVDAIELARFQRDPPLVEALFSGDAAIPEAFLKLTETMQERVRTAGPKMLTDSLVALDPRLKERLAERLGKSPEEWARSLTGDDMLKMMQERIARFSAARQGERKERPALSLDKAWHGVHYLLCGESEPGTSLLSKAVLGGTALGDDDEGFSGYGPARYFNASEVAQLAEALNAPGLETESAARFDPQRMSELGIYPGWGASDDEWVLNGLRSLRSFYAKAAADGHAVVTCIV